MSSLHVNDPRRFAADTTQPVKLLLQELNGTRPVWPGEESLLGVFKGTRLIPERRGANWYFRAWWGYYATRILLRYVLDRRPQALKSLVESVDLSPLRTGLEQKRGAIIVGNHLSAYPVIDPVLRADESLNVLSVTNTRKRKGPGVLVITSPQEQKTSLAKCLLHLRRNGVLRIALDGSVIGGSQTTFNLMGARVNLAMGAGELAILSGAATFGCTSSWASPAEARVQIYPLAVPNASSKDERIVLWYQSLLKNYGSQIRRKPEDIGFKAGFLERP